MLVDPFDLSIDLLIPKVFLVYKFIIYLFERDKDGGREGERVSMHAQAGRRGEGKNLEPTLC